MGEDEAAQLDAENVGRPEDGEAAGTGGVVGTGWVATLRTLQCFCREAGEDQVGKLTVDVVGKGHPVGDIGVAEIVGSLPACRAEDGRFYIYGEHRLERNVNVSRWGERCREKSRLRRQLPPQYIYEPEIEVICVHLPLALPTSYTGLSISER